MEGLYEVIDSKKFHKLEVIRNNFGGKYRYFLIEGVFDPKPRYTIIYVYNDDMTIRTWVDEEGTQWEIVKNLSSLLYTRRLKRAIRKGWIRRIR